MFVLSSTGRAGVVLAVVLGLACAHMPTPAFAAAAIAMGFQDGNPWTQEVGSIDNDHSRRDYTFAVPAGKTLQINLLTRNPNLYFTVENVTTDDDLVDTIKSGATTWSTPVATAATFKVRVYATPGTLPRDTTAKFALQVGQYGVDDLVAPTVSVNFSEGKPWAQEIGSVDARVSARKYSVAMEAGMTLQINLISQDPALHFNVTDPAQADKLVDTAVTGTATWSTPVSAPTTYTVQVYADAAAIPQGREIRYALQVGHYASMAPATGATAALPAAGASAGSTPAATNP